MNKKIKLLITFLTVTFLAMGFKVSAFAFTGSGAGTTTNPYIITTPAQLKEINNGLTSHYKLGADIDMTGVAFTPMGTYSTKPFTGSLDGAVYLIRNIKITGTNFTGLFQYAKGATFKNLTISNINIVGNNYVGGLVGYGDGININNCNITGEIRGASQVGGFVGYTVNVVSIEKSYSNAWIYATIANASAFGGFVGSQTGTLTIKTSSRAGSIGNTTNISVAGGLIGQVNGAVTIENCIATSNIYSGTGQLGGLIGHINSTNTIIFKDSVYLGELRGTNANKFGLADESKTNLKITNSYYVNDQYGGNINLKYSSHGRSMSQLWTQATYENWDFDNIWAINEGEVYPFFRNTPKSQSNFQGSGTAENPYIITNAAQLQAMGDNLSAHYKLGNDIDMVNTNFKPLGSFWSTTQLTYFTGSLDGAGYKIKNIKTIGHTYVGLFEYAKGAEFKNITIENADVTGENVVGILAANANDVKITNCTTSGKIKGSTYVGGLVGIVNSNITIENSSSSANLIAGISSSSYFGGLVGQSGSVNIKKSSYSGVITKMANINYLGGLVGTARETLIIEDCYAIAGLNVGAGSYIGGLVGLTYSSDTKTIKNSYYIGAINTTSNIKYGLIDEGATGVTVTNSYFQKENNTAVKYPNNARTLPQLKLKATYVGWDFNNTWAIDQGINSPYFKNPVLLSKPNISLGSKTENEIVLNWGTIGNADYYEVDYNGTIKTFTTASATITGLTPSTAYTIKVRACTSAVESDWSSDLVVTTDAPIVPALDLNIGDITYVKVSDTTIKIKWNNAVDASSYEVSHNGTIETTNTNEITITGLTADTEYILKVRGCAGIETGDWSLSLTVETNSAPSITPPPSSSSNLALSGVATSDSETNNYKADKTIDDDQTTRWLSAIGATNCYVEIDLGNMKTFNQIKINEFGARIKDYDIEVWDGSSWITVESGTGIGASFETSFSDVTGSKVRLLINTTYSTRPSISEIEIYNN